MYKYRNAREKQKAASSGTKKTEVFLREIIRFIKGGTAILLALCMLPATAFAANWFLDDGDITVDATRSNQTVTQGSTTTADDSPVITMRDTETATANTISIQSSGGAVAKLTIKRLNIESDGGDDSLIDVVGSSSADVKVKGKNYLSIDGGLKARFTWARVL